MKRTCRNGLAAGLGMLGLLAFGSAQAVPMLIGNVTDNGDGSYSLSTNPGLSDAEIEAFLGLSAGTLDGVSTGNATIGSALKDTVFVDVGDVFSFDWTWSSNEANPANFYNDFAFASLSLDGVTVLADTFTPDGTTSMFDWTATASGELTYGIGVLNVNDSYVYSFLDVSNINSSVGTVPETGSLALLCIGLPALLVTTRRRRTRQSSTS